MQSNSPNPQIGEDKELAFFGKIAAGVTHELKNVLAIINESNGLMSDFITMVKDAPFPYRERFLRCIAKIDDQVRRGVDITTRFNQFSHSMDNPVVSADLNEIVDRTVALAQRFARLKNVELRSVRSASPVLAATSPFRVQMALTRAIEACMGALNGPGTVTVATCEPPLSGVFVSCEGRDSPLPGLEELISSFGVWRDFQEIVCTLHAGVEWRQGGGGFTLLLGETIRTESENQSTG